MLSLPVAIVAHVAFVTRSLFSQRVAYQKVLSISRRPHSGRLFYSCCGAVETVNFPLLILRHCCWLCAPCALALAAISFVVGEPRVAVGVAGHDHDHDARGGLLVDLFGFLIYVVTLGYCCASWCAFH